MFAPFDTAFSIGNNTNNIGNNTNYNTWAIPTTGPTGGAGATGRGNVAPRVWGPSMWKLMHVIALTYPDSPTEQDMQEFATFFTSLQTVLPCEGCRKGYAKLISGPHRLTRQVMASRASLFKWTVDVHNAVNQKVGKKVDANYRKWFMHYRNMS